MALDEITGRPARWRGYGWKVMARLFRDSFEPEYRGDGTRIPRGVWLRAVEKPIKKWGSESYPTYTSGFHVFPRWDDAKSWNYGRRPIVRVRYRAAQLEGLQAGRKVIVAREMKVLAPGAAS